MKWKCMKFVAECHAHFCNFKLLKLLCYVLAQFFHGERSKPQSAWKNVSVMLQHCDLHLLLIMKNLYFLCSFHSKFLKWLLPILYSKIDLQAVILNNSFGKISGVVLNHHGHAGKENMSLHLSNGKACLPRMGEYGMVELSSWKEFAVEWV